MTADTMPQGFDASRRDWRIWLGMTITCVWLALGSGYVLDVVGWNQFVNQPAAGLGGFLEGAFAPLAFLWLVIGFFLQQRELTQNTEAIRAQYEMLRRSAEQAEVQARAISANELHQRQETFMMVADRVHDQLGSVAGMLWMSSQYSGDEPEASFETVGELWHRLGSGDPQAFARQFMSLHFQTLSRGEPSRDLFWGTEVRARHSATILDNWERLMASAEGCDPEGIITDALMGSGHGTLYRLIKEQQPTA